MTTMSHYPKVLITDETLRDGLQIEREGVTIEEKLELLGMMVDAGLKENGDRRLCERHVESTNGRHRRTGETTPSR